MFIGRCKLVEAEGLIVDTSWRQLCQERTVVFHSSVDMLVDCFGCMPRNVPLQYPFIQIAHLCSDPRMDDFSPPVMVWLSTDKSGWEVHTSKHSRECCQYSRRWNVGLGQCARREHQHGKEGED
jgi:hypothetical protein